MNSNKEVTPYSRESSVQSHNSLSMQYPIEAYQQSYSGSSPHSLRNVPGGHLNSSYAQPPLQAPHETFYATPSSYNPIGDFGHHGSHSAYSDSRGYDMEARSAIHGGIYESHVGSGAWNAGELHQSSMNDPYLSMSGGSGARNAAELHQSSMNDPNLRMSGGFGAQNAAELHQSSLRMSGGSGAQNAAELHQSSMNDPNLRMFGGSGAQNAAELHQSSMNDPNLRMSGGSGYLPPDSRGPFESGMATPYGFRSVFPSGFSQGVPAPRPQHENYPSGAQYPGVYAPQGVPAPWPPHERYPSGAHHPGVYAPPGPRYY
uniref:Heterogeneous nuclear ribonucleoprotein U 1 n=2 Tax=Solanum tuberosum TaxID=4113 RepID=M1C1B2_SOLTU